MSSEALDDLENTAGRWPLALVAEDNVALRELTAASLRRRGVAPVVVGSFSQAADAIAVSPFIDVALLDIHLDPNDKNSDDRGGIAIAKLLRTSSRSTKIIGYSGKFKENRLSQEEKALFDQTEAKGRLTENDHRRLWDACVDYATTSYDRRHAEVLDNQDRLRRLYEVEVKATEIIRRFRPDVPDQSPTDEFTAEGALGLAGFKIKLVRVTRSDGRRSRPFVVWAQTIKEDGRKWVNLEVYGHADLYAASHNCDSALRELAEYMELVERDLEQHQTVSDSDEKLRVFFRALYSER